MVGASAPGFATLWEPVEVDRGIRRYAELWKQDPKCAARTSDLEGTIREVLAGLPREWKGVAIDPDKVKLAAFRLLYDTGTAVQALDAFVSAKEGDWGGLALLSLSWEKNPVSGLSLGDSFCKLTSARIYEPGRDYLHEMNPPGSIIGSPLTRLSMGTIQLIRSCRKLHTLQAPISKKGLLFHLSARMFNRAIRGCPAMPKYLSCDHDPLFLFERWRANLRILEMVEIKTVPYVPLSHPFVERLIGTVRREFLDRTLFWTTKDLENKLLEFQNYFNRTH